MVVTLMSGINEVGKSILAINLATLRMREHSKVLVIDADLQKHTFLWSIRRCSGGVKPYLDFIHFCLLEGTLAEGTRAWKVQSWDNHSGRRGASCRRSPPSSQIGV